jgi:hypothetical protein
LFEVAACFSAAARLLQQAAEVQQGAGRGQAQLHRAREARYRIRRP